MILEEPIPFNEALEIARAQTALPASLSSAELARLPLEIRRRAFFSARTTNAGYLEKVQHLILELLDPGSKGRGEHLDRATVIARMGDMLRAIGYQPPEDKAGTLQDLSSFQRRALIVDTNTRMARGYGQWMQGQDPILLDEWPALEFIRVEPRTDPRLDWPDRWIAAGGKITAEGRMIARKDDPVWIGISRFGEPYPPFDFNSGMGVIDIPRDEAMTYGIIDRDTQVSPDTRNFNEDLEVSAPERRTSLFTALLETLGDDVEFDPIDGSLRMKNETPY